MGESWWARSSRRGRPPACRRRPHVSRESAILIALDIGGTSLRGVAADSNGGVVAERVERLIHGTTDAVLDQLVSLIDGLVGDGAAPDALGISVAAAPDPIGGELRSVANIPALLDVPLAVALTLRFEGRGWRTPVRVANDAELAALAEARLGAGVGQRDFVVVALGTGVGMGMVLDGGVRRGWRNMSGEVAYLPVGSPGRPRPDPAGAYESLVGGRTHRERCAEQIERSEAAGERTRLEVESTVADALVLASEGDPAAERLINNLARDLAHGIATVAALVDPELVVLSGGIGSLPGLAERTQAALATVAALAADPPRIVTSPLADRGPLLGALEMARDAANVPGPEMEE